MRLLIHGQFRKAQNDRLLTAFVKGLKAEWPAQSSRPRAVSPAPEGRLAPENSRASCWSTAISYFEIMSSVFIKVQL